jgi:hypothetical protein
MSVSAAELPAPSSLGDASAPEPSSQYLGPIVAIGLSAILIVAVAVCFGLIRRRLRGAR